MIHDQTIWGSVHAARRNGRLDGRGGGCLLCEYGRVHGGEWPAPTLPTALARVRTLTVRQREVMLLLGLDLSDGELAAALHITKRTAKFHVANVVRRLGVQSRHRAGLVARAYHEQNCPNGQ